MYEDWDRLYAEANLLNVPRMEGEISCFGMGGSGVVCDILSAFYPLVKDMKFADVVIAVSYSGNTTETLQVVRRALSMGKRVIAITSGGILSTLPVEKVLVRGGEQPRYAFPLLFLPLVKMLRPDLVREVIDGVNAMEAKRVAEDLLSHVRGKIPVFYASTYLGLAKRFKQEINENAKYPAFFGEIPEVNHNEVEGYAHGDSLYPVVFSSSEVDEVTARLVNARVIRVSGMRDVSLLIQSAGFLSVMLAREMGEDPTKLTRIPEGRRLVERIGG
ncbi:Bifunctional phosphoglucose/phosphomannose isomerase [Metallosphaera sp. J1]|uniref:SIS domain-containing protein n=1 Tax=Metallosphaera javensis (ex Hofmann et al. 2022) TaxID=99938 RepID=UPI001EDE6FC2|nr:SIS domain-containing protein [Metallosphaera javensis (ex Hofmann et al. 2022)]MCG3109759.1 Bifunctional phosphoglucose/phosphomannose isomerase [Metallosphaera javensis (ex Hofmann et al. 2022)]